MKLIVLKSNHFPVFVFALSVFFSNFSQANKLHDLLADTERLSQLSASEFARWLDRHSSISIDEIDESFGTPFQMATLATRLDLMVELHKRGADVDARNAKGETALYVAIKNLGRTKPEIAIALINLKADLTIMCQGQTYEELATDLQLDALVEALKNGPIKVGQSSKQELLNSEIKFDEEEELNWDFGAPERAVTLTLFDSENEREVNKEEIAECEIDEAFEAWENDAHGDDDRANDEEEIS